MSKHKDRPPLADWEVRLLTGSTVTVAQAWHERVKHDYVFHDETGICYTFPVRTVAWIGRVSEAEQASGFGGGGEYAAQGPSQVRIWTGVVGSGGAGSAGDYSEAAR